MHASFRTTAAAALALLGCAGCVEIAAPTIGGDYRGVLDTPFSTEGAALFELHGPGIRALSAPGRVLIAHATSDTSVRVMVMNDPRSLRGGPVSFVVTVDPGQVPPSATIEAVASPLNEARDFLGAFGMRFTRSTGPAPGGGSPPPPPGEEAPYTFAELAAQFFGGEPLPAQARGDLDLAGNGNGAYDLGDLRAYLLREPQEIPNTSSWTR